MPDVSLLIPNATRPAAMQRMLRSVLETAMNPRQIEIVLAVDQSQSQLAKFEFPLLTLRKITGPKCQLGRALQRCCTASRGDALLLASEQMVFQTHGWDAAFSSQLRRFSDGIALVWGADVSDGCPELTSGTSHRCDAPIFPCISRRAVELLGGACPVALQRHYAAAHIADVFQQLADLGHDRRAFLPEILIERVAGSKDEDDAQHAADLNCDERTYIAWDEERGLLARELAWHITATSGGIRQLQPVKQAA